MEDDLAVSQISLAKMSEQAEILKNTAENRAVKLKEGADQLGDLHSQWQETYAKLSNEKTALLKSSNTLEQVNGLL